VQGSLRPAVRTKQGGRPPESVHVLHDNARSHTTAHTRETLRELKFEVLDTPAYSPDHAPSDVHLLDPLKVVLRNPRSINDEMKEVVHIWLRTQPKHFFLTVSDNS
jgi:hypothetical protein